MELKDLASRVLLHHVKDAETGPEREAAALNDLFTEVGIRAEVWPDPYKDDSLKSNFESDDDKRRAKHLMGRIRKALADHDRFTDANLEVVDIIEEERDNATV